MLYIVGKREFSFFHDLCYLIFHHILILLTLIRLEGLFLSVQRSFFSDWF